MAFFKVVSMRMGIFNDDFGFLWTGDKWVEHFTGGIAIFELQSIGDEVIGSQMLGDISSGDVQ